MINFRWSGRVEKESKIAFLNEIIFALERTLIKYCYRDNIQEWGIFHI